MKNEIIRVRVSQVQKSEIEMRAAELHMNVSQYLLYLVFVKDKE